MIGFGAIYTKELRAYFQSPIAYALLVGFLLLTGYFFSSGAALYAQASREIVKTPMAQGLNLSQMLISPLMANTSLILMLITPLLTMRLISEEKRSGAIELLLSYPVSDAGVIFAKYLAVLTLQGIMLGLSALPTVLLSFMADLYAPGILCGYLGLILIAGGFSAVGILASCATENQIIAAAGSFALLLLLWVLSWASGFAGSELGGLLESISLSTHLEPFLKGILDTAHLAYFLLFIALFLFCAIRILEAKRWKA